jgi:hypothetical protein
MTTVFELLIGFLVATPTNPAQNSQFAMLDNINQQEELIDAPNANTVQLNTENTDIISQIHTLTVQVAKQAAYTIELHRHVAALTTHAGIVAGEFLPDSSPPTNTPTGATGQIAPICPATQSSRRAA